MTYTFNPSLADNVSLVRFHTGDNHDDGHFVEDETIRYLLTVNNNDVGLSVVAVLKYIVSQLSQPNFSVGWMNVDNATACTAYKELLIRKAQEFSTTISGVSQAVTVKSVSRSDSYQTSNDYSGGLP